MEFKIFGRILSFGKQKLPVQEEIKNEEKIESKIIAKTIWNVSNGNLNLILSDGDVIQAEVHDLALIDRIKRAEDKEAIIQLLMPTIEIKEKNVNEEEQEAVKDNLEILKEHENFDVIHEKVYFKGIKTEIPHIITLAFIDLLERVSENSDYNEETALNEEYQSLKMFSHWLLLNPIESSREDALEFVRKNHISLTTNGLLICYRNIVSVGSEKKALVKFVSESYLKVKRNKKSPKNYWVWGEDEGTFKLIDHNAKGSGIESTVGNLAELYNNLENLEENTYTDAHTRKKSIKIGQIYKEDEDKIDLDNTKDCSSGLHVGSKNFGFAGFGDTGIIALVNPMYIRSVPVSDAHKMRVSELFPACILEKGQYDKITEEKQIFDFSEEYCNQTIEELQDSLSKKSFDKISCQEHVPIVSIEEVKNITEILKNRIVQV